MTKKLIVVEGPDYAGKTTYIEKLTENYDNLGLQYYVIKLPYYFGKKSIYSRFLYIDEEKKVKKWIEEASKNNSQESWWLIMNYLHKKAKKYIEDMMNDYDDIIIIQDRNFFSTYVYQHNYFKSKINYEIFKEIMNPVFTGKKEFKFLIPEFRIIKERMLKSRNNTSKDFEIFENEIESRYNLYKKLQSYLPLLLPDYEIEVIE